MAVLLRWLVIFLASVRTECWSFVRNVRPQKLQLVKAVTGSYAELDVSPKELQMMFRADIARRHDELVVLGWLGRLYLAAPFLFRSFLPGVFRLESYSNTSDYKEDKGCVEVTLKESSVVKRGIPFKLRLEMEMSRHGMRVNVAELMGFGCDLMTAAVSSPIEGKKEDIASALSLCKAINSDPFSKRLVVQAITSAIFNRLSSISDAVKRDVELEVGEEIIFQPTKELWAMEGTSEKWLQQVSGYWFAESRLVQLRFTDISTDLRFLFYLDPTEPLNSEDPAVNVNPEAIYCDFQPQRL